MIGSHLTQRKLAAMALARLMAALATIAALIFVPAWTIGYWQAWVYLAIVFGIMSFVLIFMLLKDPGLLERRMRIKEKQPEQIPVVTVGFFCWVLVYVIPGLDIRLGWSHVPAFVVVMADVFVMLGYGMIIQVLRVNSYASRIIDVEEGQRVVTTGPYAIIRHPMYLGALVMILSTPLALASWWAVIPALPMVPVLAARIRNEEQLLRKELAGYEQYTHMTKWRLIPGVW